MKPSNFLKIFIVALICLFALQGMWLYHTYQLRKDELQIMSNKMLLDAVNDELDSRVLRLRLRDQDNKDESDSVSAEVTYDATKEGSFVSQELATLQYLLSLRNMPFELNALDSIYHSLLQEKNVNVVYQLNYRDSLNAVIATRGDEIRRGFKTDVIPIFNGANVQAVVKISYSAVFSYMLEILIVSILIVLFIIACLIYEVKVFRKQHKLSQLREDFSNAMTHDMKTPLGTIHTVLNLFSKGAFDSQPKTKEQFCAVATEQVLNLQSLVDQILTTAYIEQKKLLLNKQPIDLPQMIQSLIDKFLVKGGKEIEFEVEFDLKDIFIYADALHLKNAISNLIDNAIKYSKESVRIAIECIAGDKQVYIRIKDNGLGISKEDQKKIFDRFERGKEIKRKSASGFGLGLNYVKQVVMAHGGSVTLFSTEGKGSEFIIALPVVLSSIEDKNESEEEEII